jgi:CRISPR system Cascade subunit CasA
MMTLRYSLLDEPLIRARLIKGGRHVSYTLPALFVALADDAVRDFPALRAHQRHPWHAFLVQLAAMALNQAGASASLATEAEWKDALLTLTPDHPDGAAWCLITPPDRPALLQSPVPEGAITGWEDDTPTPDRLDVLVTSKNHELKQQRMRVACPDDWLFALVSLQTAGPYPGRGNFGVIRMNGGSSSRPGLGIAPPGGPGKRWVRDVEIATRERASIVERGGYRSNGGIGLLWLQPWDGKAAYLLSALDPFFIEICRRIRFVEHDGRIRARRKASAGPRIAKDEAKNRKGNTGDLWTPVSAAEGKSLGVSEHGFDYRRTSELLFGKTWRKPPAQVAVAADDQEGLTVIARAIAGGQSTTDGYHERRVPVSRTVRRMLVRQDTGLLERVAGERVDAIGQIHSLLRHALEALFENGNERNGQGEVADSIKKKAARFAKPFEQAEDLRFFDELNKEIEAGDREEIRLGWYVSMAARAREILRSTFDAGPRSGERRYRARVAALGRFEGRLRSGKILPTLAEHYRKQNNNAMETTP